MNTARSASRTALMTAAFRARASSWDQPLFQDPWAEQLAGAEGQALADRYQENFEAMELWAALRTAYLDEHLRHWTAEPYAFRQVVLLGAGLDTRAARLPLEGVRFYEVDQPATQEDKLQRIGQLEGYPVQAATYVPCDFEEDDFLARLSDAGFDSQSPALITWEGVTAYLSEASVRATLERVAAGFHPKSVLVFDYLSRQMSEGKNLSDKDHATRALVSGLGESFRFGSNDILPLLFQAGFRHVRALSFDELCLSYTGSYERARRFRFQHVAVASRSKSSLL